MIQWNRYSEIVVLTGAGVSLASGLSTYRGEGGLWEGSGVAEEATATCLQEDPWRVWRFFRPMMESVFQAQPNPAHHALAELEKRFSGKFLLITQNVDGLHFRAGSQKVAEIHGSLLRRRCLSSDCDLPPFEDLTLPDRLPLCPRCGHPLRPDIVLFGEQLPIEEGFLAKKSLRTVDLFLAVGTSGTVNPAAAYVRWAEYAGAKTVEVNPIPSGRFHHSIAQKAEIALGELISGIKQS